MPAPSRITAAIAIISWAVSASLPITMSDLRSTLSVEISKKIGGATFEAAFGYGGVGGGSGATVGKLTDANGSDRVFFYKATAISNGDMLLSEYTGVEEMYNTHTVRVPRPICCGRTSSQSYAVFEYLNMGGRAGSGASRRMGESLARMHLKRSDNGMFGFCVDNTIGATPQPNTWTQGWPEFWDKYRLGHILDMCKISGARYKRELEVREKVIKVLSREEVYPSLVHGDLWTGNAGYTDSGEGVIFDPATYYGHNEVDLAMSELFGRFPPDFYAGYHSVIPEQSGYEQRKLIYNAYHILNHYVLFGGSYWSSGVSMLDRILLMN